MLLIWTQWDPEYSYKKHWSKKYWSENSLRNANLNNIRPKNIQENDGLMCVALIYEQCMPLNAYKAHVLSVSVNCYQ